jgi:hypothetical protein
MTGCLDSVRVEENLPFTAESADLLDRLYGADFVVGKHNGDEAGVIPQGILDVLYPDDAVAVRVKQSNLEALLLQLCQGVENCMVLKLCGDQVVFSLSLAQAGS